MKTSVLIQLTTGSTTIPIKPCTQIGDIDSQNVCKVSLTNLIWSYLISPICPTAGGRCPSPFPHTPAVCSIWPLCCYIHETYLTFNVTDTHFQSYLQSFSYNAIPSCLSVRDLRTWSLVISDVNNNKTRIKVGTLTSKHRPDITYN